MNKIIAITTVLALGLGLANGRVQKSSLIVTPDGWRSWANLSNTTVIVGRNGGKLIGFNASLCDSDREHRRNLEPSRAPVIGFDRIPVVDLNGTTHLLSDDIIPVSTISGDIIYTTQDALSPIENSTASMLTSTPLDKFRQRSDSQRKVDKENVLYGEKRRSGSNLMNTTNMGNLSTGIRPSINNNSNDVIMLNRTSVDLPASSRASIDLFSSSRASTDPSSSSRASNDSSSSSRASIDLFSSIRASNDPSSSSRASNDPSSSNRASNNLPSSSRTSSGVFPSIESNDQDPTTIDDILNEVLNPILSSTSLWRPGPTSSSDMIYIPVDTSDIFNDNIIIETDPAYDPELTSDRTSFASPILSMTTSRDPIQIQDQLLPIEVGSPQQLLVQDQLPIGLALPDQQLPIGLASPDQLLQIQDPQLPIGIVSPDQLQIQDPQLPVGIASPEQLQIQDQQMMIPIRLGSGSRSRIPVPDQFSIGSSSRPMQDEFIPVGVASPAQLKMQERSMISDGDMVPKDDVRMMMMAGPVRPISNMEMEQECDDTVVI